MAPTDDITQRINHARGRVARSGRAFAPPGERVAAKTELKALMVERAIREAVDSAPPLTAEQREHLAALLTGSEYGRVSKQRRALLGGAGNE